jgi:hypothetical protein
MGMEPWLEHILGLGITENSVQWQESEKLLAQARTRGFLEAERLYGKAEIILEDADVTEEAFVYITSTAQSAGNREISADDEFVFDLG